MSCQECRAQGQNAVCDMLGCTTAQRLRARIRELEVELAFRKSQAEDNENAWQCEREKRIAAEAAPARREFIRAAAVQFAARSVSYSDSWMAAKLLWEAKPDDC